MSARYQEGLRKKSGRCFEGVWNKTPNLISTRRKGLVCLECFQILSERCLEGVCRVSGRCLQGVWKVSEKCLEDVWMVSEWYLEGVMEASESCLESVCERSSGDNSILDRTIRDR